MFFKNRFKKDGGSRKTLSADAGELAEGMEKVSLASSDSSAPGTSVPSSPRSQTPAASAPSGAASVSTAPSSVPPDVDTSAPGLLTVKVYTSEHVRLPIAINNNKQILQALAVNSNSESVSHELVEAITRLEETQETLSGAVAPSVLPSIITIPNATLVKSLLYLTIEFDNNALVMEPKRGSVAASTWNQVVSFDVTRPTPYVNINLFIRLPNILVQHEVGDLLVGTIKAPLALSGHSAPIRLMHHQRVPFLHDDHEAGELTMTVEFQPHLTKHLTMEDFELLKVIGKGSFGKVMQVVKKDTKQIYALKTLRKQHIIAKMEVDHTMAERTVLARVSNPFIVPLKFSFQSPEKLYLVLSFINGGELYFHLQREGRFSMDRSRFYIAELLTALETLHQMNVIYRDLKLENILLDYQGHIALCDFGLCKLNMKDNDKTNTFCGTPEYLAPELLLNQGYTRSVDWWTLGTLLYEMLTGLPPFYDENVKTMYNKILNDPLKFPPALERTDAKDLLTKLLQKDPKMRLSDAADIKAHPFFKDIDWHKLLSKSYLPPFKPNVDSLLDTSNFDQDFTNEKPQDSVVDDFLTQSVQEKFGGWTYNGESAF
ncbi:serine/threonine-protein kinase Ypk1p [Diutina catenulata]